MSQMGGSHPSPAYLWQSLDGCGGLGTLPQVNYSKESIACLWGFSHQQCVNLYFSSLSNLPLASPLQFHCPVH